MSIMVKDLMKDLEKGNRVKEVLSKPKEKPILNPFSQSATEMLMRQQAEIRIRQAEQQLAIPPQMMVANNPLSFFGQALRGV